MKVFIVYDETMKCILNCFSTCEEAFNYINKFYKYPEIVVIEREIIDDHTILIGADDFR